MSFNPQSIQFRLSMLLLTSVTLLGAAAFYGFFSLSGVLDVYDHALHEQVVHERQILTIQNDFKKQVQEWKNVLLRGHEAKSLAKYWGKFEAKEQTIQSTGTELLEQLQQPEAKRLLQDFLASHQAMGRAYREGLAKFKAADFNPQAGDRAVKGIDRKPTKVLDEAAQAISQAVIRATEDLREQASHTMLITTVMSALSLLVIVAFSVWMVQKIVIAPTSQISACLKRFAAGDFTHNEIPHFGGELGMVVNDTQQVKEHLGQIIRSVRHSAQELTSASDELTSVTENTQGDLSQQQADIQQVATTMDQMAAAVSQVSENAEAAAEAARKADQATIDGRSVVDQTIQAIGGLARDVEGASDVIKKLESDVATIATVLDVIRGIAEQTNLLALNAAIEAARAGEQGRGFAVVADEVRTLAGRTQESTSEIQVMIEKLESGTVQAVKVMGESRQQAEASVEQATSTGQSFTVIAEAVAAIAEMNQQIAVSSTEQSTVTEEIHRKVTSINNLAEHTGKGAQHWSEAGGRVSALAQQMESQVSQFKI